VLTGYALGGGGQEQPWATTQKKQKAKNSKKNRDKKSQKKNISAQRTLVRRAMAALSGDTSVTAQVVALLRVLRDQPGRGGYTAAELCEVGGLGTGAPRAAVLASLQANERVRFDAASGLFSYAARHGAADAPALLRALRSLPDGARLADVIDAFPGAPAALDALARTGGTEALWLAERGGGGGSALGLVRLANSDRDCGDLLRAREPATAVGAPELRPSMFTRLSGTFSVRRGSALVSTTADVTQEVRRQRRCLQRGAGAHLPASLSPLPSHHCSHLRHSLQIARNDIILLDGVAFRVSSASCHLMVKLEQRRRRSRRSGEGAAAEAASSAGASGAGETTSASELSADGVSDDEAAALAAAAEEDEEEEEGGGEDNDEEEEEDEEEDEEDDDAASAASPTALAEAAAVAEKQRAKELKRELARERAELIEEGLVVRRGGRGSRGGSRGRGRCGKRARAAGEAAVNSACPIRRGQK
jgi:hypothetical protein